MERHNGEGHQSDECDVRWNLPNSIGQTGLGSTDHPVCYIVTGRTKVFQGPGKLLEMASVLVKFRNLVKTVVESAAIPVTIYAVVR